jgi:hypothetical protein
MSSETARTAAPARGSADLSGRDPAQTLAGLIDVLDRADGLLVGQRPRPRRSAAYRPTGSRAGARTVPLRSIRPAPMARPAPVVVPAPGTPAPGTPAPGTTAPGTRAPLVPAPAAPVGRLRGFTRRVALWGAGPQGEYLAWRPAPHGPAPRPSAATAPHRRSRAAAFVRRVALWGAGPQGQYLAWSAPGSPRPVPPPSQAVDGPVVLRAMPSTPTIQPAATSPAAALLPRDPASSAGSRGMPPVPRGAVAVPGMRPSGPPEHSRATGWPSPARPSPEATGLVRARGDPLPAARGSPPPARRARSPGSSPTSNP